MNSIKAIETIYKGYRFRSRLEARWAIFFDALGIRWEYEKEGYDLGDGVYYLPDFWFPDLGTFIEIKASDPNEDEGRKVSLLEEQSGHRVYILSGSPSIDGNSYSLWAVYNKVCRERSTVFRCCPKCGSVGLLEEACGCRWRNRWFSSDEHNYRLQAAMEAAQQARFEHGEGLTKQPMIPYHEFPKQSIYLAGKITSRNKWRNEIVRGLSDVPIDWDHNGYMIGDAREYGSWPVLRESILSRHDYVGPYAIDFEDGDSHGMPDVYDGGLGIFDACLEAIKRASLVFAWIEEPDVHGTLVELGYARAEGKTIWIAGPRRFPEMWFVYKCADFVTFKFPTAEETLRALACYPTYKPYVGEDERP